MAQLVLRLSGGFDATGPDGAALPKLSRRGQALLAFLSQQRDMRAERGELADLLWSDRAEAQARASLRQELALLRKALPSGALKTSRQFVGLTADLVAIDTTAEGEFLKGFDLPSEAFEEWLRDARGTATKSPPEGPGSQQKFLSRPAVLLFSFDAISSGEQDAMIATGLAEDLLTSLSCWRWFPVIGPEAIGWKTAKEVDLLKVAADVAASYAVSGSLRCFGNRVKITVSLTEVSTGQSKWSKAFEGTLDDVFGFQEDVSRAIVAQLEPQISRAEAMRISRMPPHSLVPWQLVAQADEIERKGGEGYGTAESNFAQARLMEKALAQYPQSSSVLTRLSRIHFRAAMLDWVPDRHESFQRSLDFSERALRIDPDNWEAHAYCGLARVNQIRDYTGGVFHGDEAVRLNPSSAVARHAVACALEWNGQVDAALPHMYLIFRLNPNYAARAAILGQIATCELLSGNRDNALEAAQKMIAIAPNYARGLQRCVSTFGYFDEPALASQALEGLLRVQPDFDEAYVRRTYPYARTSDLETILLGFHKTGVFSQELSL